MILLPIVRVGAYAVNALLQFTTLRLACWGNEERMALLVLKGVKPLTGWRGPVETVGYKPGGPQRVILVVPREGTHYATRFTDGSDRLLPSGPVLDGESVYDAAWRVLHETTGLRASALMVTARMRARSEGDADPPDTTVVVATVNPKQRLTAGTWTPFGTLFRQKDPTGHTVLALASQGLAPPFATTHTRGFR